MTEQPRIALVTGANRGIGLDVCRQLAQHGFTVVLGSRNRTKGETAVRQLGANGGAIQPQQLDVTDQDSIERLRTHVESVFGHLDVLVNNAAILYDTDQYAQNADLASGAAGARDQSVWRVADVRVVYSAASAAASTGESSTYRAKADHSRRWAPGHLPTAPQKLRSTR